METQYQPDQTLQSDLRQYIALLWQWAWLIILATLLAGVTAFLVSSYMEPVYQATTSLLINEAPGGQTSDYTALLTSERLARTYSEMLTKRPVLEQVLERLDLEQDYETIDGFRKTIEVQLVRDTQLIDLNVEDTDPEQAAAIANAIVDVFVEQNESLQASRFAESKTSLEEQLERLDGQIHNTTVELDQLEDKPENQAARDRLQAQLDQYRQAYAELIQSYEDVRVAEAQATSNVVQVETAIPPEEPVRPRVLMNTALAAVVGGMLAIGAIFLIETLDDTIKSPEEINRHLGLPVLGTILSHDNNGDLISSDSPRSPTAEAFRSLRTNIQYASVDYPIRTLLVTSSTAGEGKSTVVANLGTVLAQSDIRTVLIEADMRRPKLHQYLKAHNRFGLSSLFVSSSNLMDMQDISDMLQTISMEKMSLLSSGKAPPNPSELLASEKMSNLLATLQEDSTIVIVDSPPVIAVTDATVLAPRMDAVLLVVKPGETKLEAARQTVEQLRRVGANLVGVVLNGVDPRSSRYGYYYRYDREYYHEDEQELVGMPAWQRWGLAGLGLFLALLIGGIALWTSPNAAFGAWLGGKPTASPTAVAETPIAEAASEIASATPTLTLTLAGTLETFSESQLDSQSTAMPEYSPTPTTTPTITLTPTPGPGFLTPFGTEREYLLHQVKFGDNLPNLSDQYNTDRDVIIAVNGLFPGQSLQPDQVIVIMPGRTDSVDVPELSVIFLEEATPIDEFASLRGLTPEEVRQYNQLGPGDIIPGGRWLIFPERQVTPTVAATAIPTPDLSMALTEPFGPEDQLVLHQVSVGESVPVLEEIYVTTARTIRAINDIDGSIQVGDVLVIMPDRQSPGEMPQFSVYRVQENITVEALATELDIPADDLTYYNDLEAGQEIQAERWLIYPTPADLSKALTEPFGPDGAYVLHQVAQGESIPVLEDRYKTSATLIYAVNDIAGSIQTGQVLVMLPDQLEVGDTPRFSVFWVQEETDVNALAAELGVLPEDLTYYNSLEADQPITVGQWIIYPAPTEN